MPVRGPHGYLAGVRQGHGAGLADDLAADVVAVTGVDEQLVVDEGAAGHLQHQDQRVLHAVRGLAAAARAQDGRGHDFLVEQPPHDVDLVHRRVADGHLGGEIGRHRRVAVRAVHQQRRAERAVVQRRLHGPVAGVVAAHEADLDQPPPGRELGVHDPLAGGAGRGERLLAEHRLAGRDRGQDLLLVGRAPGGDQDRVDAIVRDEAGRRLVHGGAGQARRDLPGTLLVDVVHRADDAAGEHVGDPADVVLADHPHPDDADADRGVGGEVGGGNRRPHRRRSFGYSSSAPTPTPRR